MLFPDTQHIIFQKNTLTGVTCQLNFPPILKIAHEVPSAFQDAVRVQYPLFETRPIVSMLMTPGSALPAPSVTNSYVFLSMERPTPQATLALTQESLALTTTAYRRRSEFFAQLQKPLDALQGIYSPPFLTRTGLRYQNLISRKGLGLEGHPWHGLLRPAFLGMAAASEVAELITVDYAQIQFPADAGRVILQHGLTMNAATQEQCYLIDIDVYTDERVELQNVTDIFKQLNMDAIRLYHWCLSDTLKAALDPRDVAGSA